MNVVQYIQQTWGLERAAQIGWAHAINSRAEFAAVHSNPSVHIIEADIVIDNNGIAVMGHPPATSGDLRLEDFLTDLQASKQGIKLDFKDWRAVPQGLEMLNRLQLTQLVILNADIMQGNGAAAPVVPAEKFIEACRREFPNGILSLGWTTRSRRPYTAQNVDAMLTAVQGLDQVLFPIRTSLAKKSWPQLQRLIPQDKPGWALSFWNTVDEVPSRSDIAWLTQQTRGRALYDFMDKTESPIVPSL